MGNYRDSSIFLLGALAACSSNNTKSVDAPIVLIDAAPDAPKAIDAAIDAAPIYDFSCEGVALPTTAATSITLSGTAITLNGTSVSAAPDVTVELYKGASPTVLDTQTTAQGTGAYTMAAQNNPSALPYDGYLKATKTGNRTTYVVPASPFVADQANIPILTLSTGTFSTLATFIGATQSPSNGSLGTVVVDCALNPVSGATVIVKQGGTVVGNTHDLSGLNAQAAGLYFTFDVPPGDTDLSATYGSHTWRVHTVKSYAGATTTTNAVP